MVSTASFTQHGRRQQLLAVAIDLLATRGLPGASMSSVAASAGVNKSLVNYYFGTHDGLLDALMEHLFGAAGLEIDAAVASVQAPIAKVRRYVDANLRWISTHPREARALTEVVVGRRDAEGEPWYSSRDGDVLAGHLASLVTLALPGTRSAHLDPRSVALSIRALIDVAPVHLMTDPVFDLPAYRLAVDAILESLLTPGHGGQQ